MDEVRAGQDGQVSNALREEGMLVEELFKMTERLEERLSSVLRKDGDVEESNKSPQEVLTPLADQITSYNQQLSKIISKLGGLLRRIEL
jgi:flagellar capping protein FliD